MGVGVVTVVVVVEKLEIAFVRGRGDTDLHQEGHYVHYQCELCGGLDIEVGRDGRAVDREVDYIEDDGENCGGGEEEVVMGSGRRGGNERSGTGGGRRRFGGGLAGGTG